MPRSKEDPCQKPACQLQVFSCPCNNVSNLAITTTGVFAKEQLPGGEVSKSAAEPR